MRCPSCSAPLLYGAADCTCGYQHPAGVRDPLEISYWEAFRAWWRIYWPTQLISLVFQIGYSKLTLAAINRWQSDHPLETFPGYQYLGVVTIALTVILSAACLWLFTPRIFTRAYRGFHVVACVGTDEVRRFTPTQRLALSFFVWWRQLAGGLLAMVLAMPLNTLLGTMQINASSLVGGLAGLFAIGPIIIKMLVGSVVGGMEIQTRPAAVHEVPAQPAAEPDLSH